MTTQTRRPLTGEHPPEIAAVRGLLVAVLLGSLLWALIGLAIWWMR